MLKRLWAKTLYDQKRSLFFWNFGMIGINTTTITSSQSPFGGINESGYGKEGGKEGLEEYLISKYVTISGGKI